MKAQFISPIVTPLTRELQLDERALGAVIERMAGAGISGIVLLGSIGEFFAFSRAEKARMIELAARQTRGKTRLIVGVGSMDAQETIELMQRAKDAGADGVMCVSPYYFSLSERDIEAYYDHIVPRAGLDFYLYNFPARTGYDLSPQLTLRLLARHKRIVGYKDSVNGMDHTRRLLLAVRDSFPDFQVFSGFDDNFVHNVLAGGAGCIGGLSNIMPEVCMQLVRAAEQDDLAALRSLQPLLDDMMRIYDVAPLFIPVIKRAMMLRDFPIEPHCSFPIQPASEEQVEQVRAILAQNGLL